MKFDLHINVSDRKNNTQTFKICSHFALKIMVSRELNKIIFHFVRNDETINRTYTAVFFITENVHLSQENYVKGKTDVYLNILNPT